MQNKKMHLDNLIKSSLFCIIFTLLTVTISYAAANPDKSLQQGNNVTNADQKIIYLTFDDGPSKIMTNRALSILEKYNIKATFFIVGVNIKGNEDVLKRIYEDGNAIGLHSFTHKYKKIYKSKDEFITEMLQDSFEIRKVIGISPTAIRFPGGSSKILSRDYLEQLHKYNFKVYDWNMALSDGLNPNLSTSKFFREATKDADKKSKIILLMHCNEENGITCQVLPRIIEFYQKQGFEFKIIDKNTPELYGKIKS